MKKSIIVTSFGTTNLVGLKESIERIEGSIEQKFKDEYLILKAFTSKFIINKLKENSNINRLYIEDALEYLKENNYDVVIIQPLNIISGGEVDKIKKIASKYEKYFHIEVGLPLLSGELEDYKALAKILCKDVNKKNNVVFVGHGVANNTYNFYKEIENNFRKLGYDNIHIGTLEGCVNVHDINTTLRGKNVTYVELRPLLLTCGNHVVKDINGEKKDSWKSILSASGIETTVNLKSLGEYDEIRKIYLKRIELSILNINYK